MNTYRTTSGERFTQSQIDAKIRKAKEAKIAQMFELHGYVFCEDCGKNEHNTFLDCSHNESVKKSKEEGRTEKAWEVENITIRCRECHREYDKLNIK